MNHLDEPKAINADASEAEGSEACDCDADRHYADHIFEGALCIALSMNSNVDKSKADFCYVDKLEADVLGADVERGLSPTVGVFLIMATTAQLTNIIIFLRQTRVRDAGTH